MALKLSDPPSIEPVSLADVISRLRLDVTSPDLSSGTLVIGRHYLITACLTNAFYTGCSVGDTFQASAATALTASNKVREIYEGDQLMMLVKTARQYLENLCGPMIEQTWEQYLQAWPATGVMDLELPRVLEVDSIEYEDADGVDHILTATDYVLDAVGSYHGRVVLKSAASWPSSALADVNPIVVTFNCGYGDEAEDVPEPLRLAILLLVAQWYENREVVNIGNIATPLPFTVEALIANYRLWWGL